MVDGYGERMRRCALWLGALWLAAAGARASAEAGPEIRVTPDTVELTDAGNLRFPIDIKALELPYDASTTIQVRLWFDAEGRAVQCTPLDADAAAASVCAQAPRLAHFTLAPGFALPLRRGSILLRLRAFPHDASTPGRLQADLVPEAVRARILYPPDDTPGAARLAAGVGRLEAPSGPAEYPPRALRWQLSGRVEALLGVRSDGTIATCRPLASSGAAALDNATCTMLAVRAQYRFAAAQTYSGMRFAVARIAWVLPKG